MCSLQVDAYFIQNLDGIQIAYLEKVLKTHFFSFAISSEISFTLFNVKIDLLQLFISSFRPPLNELFSKNLPDIFC